MTLPFEAMPALSIGPFELARRAVRALEQTTRIATGVAGESLFDAQTCDEADELPSAGAAT